jgi:hypothetical protein
MKLEWHNRWVRFVLELFPGLPAIRHHRVLPARLEGSIERAVRRRILQRLAETGRDSA